MRRRRGRSVARSGSGPTPVPRPTCSSLRSRGSELPSLHIPSASSSPGPSSKPANPTIELKDFAAHVVEKFKVNKIEPWTGHFPSTDAKYLEQFRAAVEKAKAAIANIAVDGEHSPYAADRSEREQAIAFSKQWIDEAVALGSPSIRTNIPAAKGVAAGPRPHRRQPAASGRIRVDEECGRQAGE